MKNTEIFIHWYDRNYNYFMNFVYLLFILTLILDDLEKWWYFIPFLFFYRLHYCSLSKKIKRLEAENEEYKNTIHSFNLQVKKLAEKFKK